MQSQKNHKKIFQKYLDNQCSPEEVDWLLSFLKSNHPGAEVNQIFEQQLSRNITESNIGNPFIQERLKMRLEKILEEIAQNAEVPVISLKGNFGRRFNWSRLAAAAVLVFLVSFGIYYFFNQNIKREIAEINTPAKQDIVAPASVHATITLANGKRIILDSAGNGSIANEGDVNIEKIADGQIAYIGSNNEVSYNTLTNPRGSKNVSLTLSDGSRVWLNAGSSLKYPASFSGVERKVAITGEAYFEIAHNASKPFKVQKGETAITVLGTHFNVNAYDDETDFKVTLLEGSVEVKDKLSMVKIKPGQQASISNKKDALGNTILVKTVDIENAIAWKNGLFIFDNTDLATILRELSRWYNLKVEYDGKLSDAKFGGGVSKSLPLSNVLKLMEANGVTFKLDGNILRVLP